MPMEPEMEHGDIGEAVPRCDYDPASSQSSDSPPVTQ